MASDHDILAATRVLAGAIRAKEAARAREAIATGDLSAAQAAVQRTAQGVQDAQAALHRLLASAAIPEPPKAAEPAAAVSAPAEPPVKKKR